MTDEQLADALERAAYGAVILNPEDFIEAARRLRTVEANEVTLRHLLAQAVNGEYATVSHLVDEVERLRSGLLGACTRTYAWMREQMEDAESIAAIAMECGLRECDRLRARRDEAVEAAGTYRAEWERAANDDLLRRILTLMDACDARDARLARAEKVIDRVRKYLGDVYGWASMVNDADGGGMSAMTAEEALDSAPTVEGLRAALAEYDGKDGE